MAYPTRTQPAQGKSVILRLARSPRAPHATVSARVALDRGLRRDRLPSAAVRRPVRGRRVREYAGGPGSGTGFVLLPVKRERCSRRDLNPRWRVSLASEGRLEGPLSLTGLDYGSTRNDRSRGRPHFRLAKELSYRRSERGTSSWPSGAVPGPSRARERTAGTGVGEGTRSVASR